MVDRSADYSSDSDVLIRRSNIRNWKTFEGGDSPKVTQPNQKVNSDSFGSFGVKLGFGFEHPSGSAEKENVSLNG